MIPTVSGATRLYVIVGDPIAQCARRAASARPLPSEAMTASWFRFRVATADLPDFLSVAARLKNLDGIVATIPHKFFCYEACASATRRAHFLRVASLLRRRADGKWHGEE